MALSIVALCPFFLKFLNGLYTNFVSSSVVFHLDTLYLNWNTTFPAVTVCEIYNGEKIWDISEEYYGSDRDSRLDDYISEIIFYSGTCSSCQRCDEIVCSSNFEELAKVFRTDCPELIKNCSWIGQQFNCCAQFLPIRTEYGLCFSFNSLQAENHRKNSVFSNRATGPAFLNFQVSEDVQIFMHSSLDIPYLFSEGVIRETVLWGTSKEIIFNVMEIYNDPSVGHLDPIDRHCKFSTELDITTEPPMFPFYSFSACILECTKMIQVALCNCAQHFIHQFSTENTIAVCNITGLLCLSNNYKPIFDERKNCKCTSSCEEPEYNIVYTSPEDTHQGDSDISDVRVAMVELPTQRYIRKVTKNYSDFLISVGGIAGLFFGASLIRVLELFFKLYFDQHQLF